MKVSCLQENLAKGLGIVGRAVASRSTLPVLSNVLLTTEGNQLKLSANNFELGINCWVGAKIEQEGAITIPARLLTEFVTPDSRRTTLYLFEAPREVTGIVEAHLGRDLRYIEGEVA